MDFQDTAQICMNGHVANDMAVKYPAYNKSFCEECGEKTTTTCPSCAAPIRGHMHIDGVIGFHDYSPPSYCSNCGAAMPWMERRLEAAAELARELANLDDGEAQQFGQSLKDIAQDSPRTALGATRVKKVLTRMGAEGAQAMRDIVVDIASETARKLIWPGP